MKTLTGLECLICKGADLKRLFRSSQSLPTLRNGRYHITRSNRTLVKDLLICGNCEFIFLPKELLFPAERYAEGEDSEYAGQAEQRFANAERLLKELKSLKPGAKLLDCGSACGFLLKTARDRFGFETYGIEPSSWGVDYARGQFALNIEKGFIETHPFQKDIFDAVVLADVIEHLENPKRAVQELRQILNPGGQLLILTPDIGSWTARLAGKYWWGLLDEHNFYFSRKTLRELLENCGFRVRLLRSFGRTLLLRDWALKLAQYSTSLYRTANAVLRGLRLDSLKLYLDLGDQMVCVAEKKL